MKVLCRKRFWLLSVAGLVGLLGLRLAWGPRNGTNTDRALSKSEYDQCIAACHILADKIQTNIWHEVDQGRNPNIMQIWCSVPEDKRKSPLSDRWIAVNFSAEVWRLQSSADTSGPVVLDRGPYRLPGSGVKLVSIGISGAGQIMTIPFGDEPEWVRTFENVPSR